MKGVKNSSWKPNPKPKTSLETGGVGRKVRWTLQLRECVKGQSFCSGAASAALGYTFHKQR